MWETILMEHAARSNERASAYDKILGGVSSVGQTRYGRAGGGHHGFCSNENLMADEQDEFDEGNEQDAVPPRSR